MCVCVRVCVCVTVWLFVWECIGTLCVPLSVVCVWLCGYLCECVRIYIMCASKYSVCVCICVCPGILYTCLCGRLSTSLLDCHGWGPLCICICILMCTRLCVCVCACLCMCVCVCVCVFRYAIHCCMGIYFVLQIVCVCVCVCVCVPHSDVVYSPLLINNAVLSAHLAYLWRGSGHLLVLCCLWRSALCACLPRALKSSVPSESTNCFPDAHCNAY